MENTGIDPVTSRMLSERSTIWANSPRNINVRSALFEYSYWYSNFVKVNILHNS